MQPARPLSRLRDMSAVGRAKRASAVVLVCVTSTLLLAACGSHKVTATGGTTGVGESLPVGVMSAHRACSLVLKRPRGTFVGIKQVHLVLTTYAKGEPVESHGDYSAGTPPQTLVWVVEVHAKAIHVAFSVPPGTRPILTTDYSVVMNAKTGLISDSGLGRDWPLPLWRVGTMISLAGRC